MKQIINRQVRSHTRFDPRLNKRVDVKTYNRRQEVNIYKPITRAKAEEVFLSKSKKAQSVDLSRNAKTILEIPTEEWLKKSSNIDIRGLDTFLEKKHIPSEKSIKKETKYSHEDFFNPDLYFKKKYELTSEEATLKKENEYYEDYFKKELKDENSKISKKYQENKKKILKVQKKIKALKINWQRKPENYIYKELDPRYKTLLENSKNEIRNMNYHINNTKKGIQNSKNVPEINQTLQRKLGEQEKVLHEKQELYNNLKENPKYRYWTKDIVIESVKRKQKIPEYILEAMNKQPELDPLKIKIGKIETAREQYTSKKNIREMKKDWEHEKIEEQLIRDTISKFEKNTKNKSEKYQFQDYELTTLEGKKGFMDPLRITAITTSRNYKKLKLYVELKERKYLKISEETPLYLDSDGDPLYSFNNITLFKKEDIDRALKSIKNPIMLTKKREDAFPVIIKNQEITYMLAPNVFEDDKIPEAYIKTNIREYDQLNKLNKKQLIEKGKLSEYNEKTSKSQLVYLNLLNKK